MCQSALTQRASRIQLQTSSRPGLPVASTGQGAQGTAQHRRDIQLLKATKKATTKEKQKGSEGVGSLVLSFAPWPPRISRFGPSGPSSALLHLRLKDLRAHRPGTSGASAGPEPSEQNTSSNIIVVVTIVVAIIIIIVVVVVIIIVVVILVVVLIVQDFCLSL